MNNFADILPGTRVRGHDGFIGTVERLDGQADNPTDEPSQMVVRSEDGQSHYVIPLLLTTAVAQDTFHPLVQVNLTADELTHYLSAESTFDAPTASAEAEESKQTANQELVIPLASEELYTQKKPVQLGTVHLHKRVETAEEELTVPVYYEEPIVEHIPADQFDANAPTSPNEIIVPVMEEQLVVEKRQVVKEYIRIRKNLVAQQQNVHDHVRREFVEITESHPEGKEETPYSYKFEPTPE